MSNRLRWVGFSAGAALLLSVVAASAQSTIKRVPIKSLDTVDGHAIYDRECAVCHGPLGRGDGRAAKHLGVPVPDLTLIAVRDGRLDLLQVRHKFTDPPGSHAQMPDWDRLLHTAYSRQSAGAAIAEVNLAKYIRELQRPAQ